MFFELKLCVLRAPDVSKNALEKSCMYMWLSPNLYAGLHIVFIENLLGALGARSMGYITHKNRGFR